MRTLRVVDERRLRLEQRLRFGMEARLALLRGVRLMARLIRPTLGPLSRTVAIAPIVGKDPPEVLDSGATIARRTIQLADPFENMGAMLLRHLAWRVFEATGDGAATAAVLAEQLLAEATRHVAAGYSPVGLARGIDQGLGLALEALCQQAEPIEQPAEIAGVVAGGVRDPELAAMLGEIIDAVGPDGAVLIEDALGTRTEHDYLDGVHWNAGYLSAAFLPDGETTIRLTEPCIFLTDAPLERVEQLLPAVEACIRAGERRLFVIAPDLRDAALALLLVNRERGVLEQVAAVRAPSIGAQRTRILEDLAAMTGGRCIRPEAGESLAQVRIEDFGRARHAWATRQAFGILGGRGAKEAIRQRIREARAELSAADDDYTRGKLRERIGKLAGAVALLRVGAPIKREQEALKQRLEAAATTARLALAEGVVPGGGAALVWCAEALAQPAVALPSDEAMGVRALRMALVAPMAAIAGNAGLEPGPILCEAQRRGAGWTFDVVRCQWVQARTSGLVDPLAVIRAALEMSTSAAKLALTAEVLVRRKWPLLAAGP